MELRLGVQLGIEFGCMLDNLTDEVLIEFKLGVQLVIEFWGKVGNLTELVSLEATLGAQLGTELDKLSLDINPSAFIGSLLDARVGGGGICTRMPLETPATELPRGL
jgi:hypothetical protein